MMPRPWCASRRRKLAELGDQQAVPTLQTLLQQGGVAAVEAYGLLARLGAKAAAG